MQFGWDPHKAARNQSKHKVSFSEAATVFGDWFSSVTPDPDHSIQEERYLIVGLSNKRRPLIVAFAERGERIRIISARRLTPTERKAYEEETGR